MLDNTHVTHIEKDKENDTYNIDHPTALTKGQKLAATGLAFFAFLTVVIWSVQLKNSIGNPFQMKTQNTGGLETTLNNNKEICTDCQESDEDSKLKDTDGDGLWDWDEVNLYHTSPYLEDTDSDGVLDKAEIDKGLDPICPEGQNCSGDFVNSSATIDDTAVIGENTDTSKDEMLDIIKRLEALQAGAVSDDTTNTNMSSDEKAIQDLLGGKAGVDDLRAMLKTAGMDDASVEKLSDEELMEVYREMIK